MNSLRGWVCDPVRTTFGNVLTPQQATRLYHDVRSHTLHQILIYEEFTGPELACLEESCPC